MSRKIGEKQSRARVNDGAHKEPPAPSQVSKKELEKYTERRNALLSGRHSREGLRSCTQHVETSKKLKVQRKQETEDDIQKVRLQRYDLFPSFCMALHKRLGKDSPASLLNADLLKVIGKIIDPEPKEVPKPIPVRE